MKINRILAATIFAVATATGAIAQDKILVTNVSVWDGSSDAAIAADVLIEGSKIIEVAAGISSDGATVIDGKGGTVIPGLMDSHQHVMVTPTVGPNEFNNTMSPYMVGYLAIPQVQKLLMMGITRP